MLSRRATTTATTAAVALLFSLFLLRQGMGRAKGEGKVDRAWEGWKVKGRLTGHGKGGR